MKKYGLVCALLVLFAACILFAGCTGTGDESAATPTAVPTAAETAAVKPAETAPPVAVVSGTYVFTQDDNGKSFIVKPGSTIEVQLAGNPTTGYEWSADGGGLTVVGDPNGTYVMDEAAPGMVGVGGMFTFTYEAETDGTYTITAGYARSWETDVEPADAFTLTVIVDSKAPVYVMADSGTTVKPGVNSVFTVALEENPTTGYQWAMSAEGESVALLSDIYVMDGAAPGMVGVGGTHFFYYQAESAGTSVINGVYKQAWMETSPEDETFTLTAEVA